MKYKSMFMAVLLAACPALWAAPENQPALEEMNTAPILSDLPSPIIGDLPGATTNNVFIFEDAWNLSSFVSDDFSTDGAIVWSYNIFGTPIYSINGVPPLDNDDPTSPPVEKRIQLHDLDPTQLDNDPYTITLRDILLSPDDGSTTYTEPGAPGIVHSQVVTFWASDGSTASSKSTIFYTENDGVDRFSGDFEIVKSFDFGISPHGWVYRQTVDGSMTGAQGSDGLCITTVLFDTAIEGWISNPADPFDLVDNSVYELDLAMSSTANFGATPILQFVVSNTAGTETDGYAYGGEFFIIDWQGGANAIASRPDGEYLWYFAPPQARVSNWRSASAGAFAPTNAGIKNFRMEMNVFDIDSVANGSTRAGTICLTNLLIRRADINSVQTGATVYDIDPGGFTPDNFGILQERPFENSGLTRSFVEGNLVASATSSSLSLLFLEPGPEPFAPDSAHFPIPVVADQAYMIQWTVTASAGTNPIEIIRLNADTPTNEVIQNAFAAASGAGLGAAALPTMGGSAEVYTGFFYTHSATLSPGLSAVWRPTLTLANREDVNGAMAADNTLTFSSVSVVPLN